MQALITGMTGIIGTHFARAARAGGWYTVGIAGNSASSHLAAEEADGVRCDMLDVFALEDVFRKVQPEVVVHLAAQAFNGTSWQAEWATHQANYIGTVSVLRCCRTVSPRSRVLLACSSAEYGDVKLEDCPIREEALGFQHFHNYGMQVYLPRLFIHVGTGPPATAIQNFARQIAMIAQDRMPPIVRGGKLETARDFVDVRDGVNALMLQLEKGQPGQPMNISNGEAVSIRDVLRMLIEISGQQVQLIQGEAFIRPVDEPRLLGDNSLIRQLGWILRGTLQQTLEDVYEDWMERVGRTVRAQATAFA